MDNCNYGPQYRSDCLICGHKLEYLSSSADLTCFYCGKKEKGNIACSSDKSHYVCDDCHNLSSFNFIKDYLLTADKTNPFEITSDILNNPAIPMLGCHHAYILTGSILTVLKNRGYICVTDTDMEEAFSRLSRQAVGGYCGLSGVCGITPAGGIVYSILTGSVCGKDKEQKATMGITAELSKAIYGLTGPSCCKAYLFKALEILTYSLYADFDFLLADSDIEIKCSFKDMHPHGCRFEKCPYFAGYNIKIKELKQMRNAEEDSAAVRLNINTANNKNKAENAADGTGLHSGAPAAPC
ncbi:MAG: DUF5714 domain-containing protein [bacterium]